MVAKLREYINPYPHSIHVTGIFFFLHEWLIYMGNVGKYTIHGSYGYALFKVTMVDTRWYCRHLFCLKYSSLPTFFLGSLDPSSSEKQKHTKQSIYPMTDSHWDERYIYNP